MRAIVTGANGFIGRRIVERCATAGWDVVAFVQPGLESVLRGSAARVVGLDLNELKAVPSWAPSADVLFHLAWVGVAPEERNDPAKQLPNLKYGFEVVEAAAALNVARIICPGSMSEFALHDGPVTGYEDPSPIDLYSATKVAAREIMGVRCAQLGVGLVWTLITSVYGPGRADSNLISYAIRSLIARKRPRFTRLEQVWDYIYIDDLVEALYLVGLKGVAGRRYPIGSGTALPIARYVAEIRDAIDPELPLGIGELPYRSSRLDMSVPEIGALVADTGYQARTSFSDGITATIRHLRSETDVP